MVELGEIIEYEQPTKYLVNSVDYNDNFETPVLTAGQSFILGHTNETKGIYSKNLPVIIFDDFTTASKFVDFNFKVKSSALKILHINHEMAIVQYVYHIMQNIKFDSSIHKRYWISEFSKLKIPLPPLKKQEEIAEQIEREQKAVDECKKLIEIFEGKIKEKIGEVWGTP